MVSDWRRKLEQSERLTHMVSGGIGAYLRLCHRRVSWQTEGLEALQAQLSKGPVLMMMWHARTLMGPLHWPISDGAISTLHADSPIGRVAGAFQRSNGMDAVPMRQDSNLSASRHVLRSAKRGASISIACDGPNGPARQVKDAPILWARKTGLPIWSYAFSTSKGRELNTWDHMWFPWPAGRGAIVFNALTEEIDTSDEVARVQVGAFLDRTVEMADAMVGR